MFPSNAIGQFGRILLFALFACLTDAAFASPRVALLLSDVESTAAATAVRELRQERAYRGVSFTLYNMMELAEADRRPLREADLVFARTTGRSLVTAIKDDMRQIKARGGRIYAIGNTWDEDFPALGLSLSEEIRAYMSAGGPANIANMIRAALWKDHRLGRAPAPPAPLPEMAYMTPHDGHLFERHADFLRHYKARPGAPWIGILFSRSNALSAQTATISAIAAELEKRGFNVLPAFGYPNDIGVRKLFLDEAGRSRIRALAALAMKIGATPDKMVPVLEQLDVPVINAIPLYSQSREQWEASPLGLDIMERGWQVAGAEFAGAIAPTVVAAKETRVDPTTGLKTIAEEPIPERVTRLAERLQALAQLASEPPEGKRVAIIYYNYPPGKDNIGASYLNVLPRSLWQVLSRLRAEGYWAGRGTNAAPTSENALFEAIHGHGANLDSWEQGALELAVRSGHAVTWPVAEYRRHFDRLPAPLREAMVKSWGKAEDAKIGLWRDARGQPHFVFPAQRWGNLLFAPQPSRGWEQDVKKLYHDVTLPPHHQYLAFYLWLQKDVKTHAMIHVGTHATHEWHSGKEVGYTAADPGEVFVGAVPQFYPYIVDDIGEGLQAKRRGMAALVSHMTPPLDKASLNPDLKLLVGLISDYGVAKQKGPLAAEAIRADIEVRSRKMGLLKDLGLDKADDEAIDALEHHIKEIEEKRSPFGLHTFGVAPTPELRRATAESILSLEPGLAALDRARRTEQLTALIETSARHELDALLHGLAGGYIAAGSGNDPMRNPDSLPTGRNLYGFDPTRLPTSATYALGARLAEDLVASYRQRHGRYPKRLVFNLWGVESSRHEGAMEAQIMALWGVRPVWDARGRVTGVEAIPRQQMERPRVDVTVVPSGLYRDLFSPLVKLLDEGASAAQAAIEDDNPLRAHVRETRQALLAKGVPAEQAERLAAVRLFSVPSGAYGTNLDKVIPLSNTWNTEKEVADVYFMRMSHPFGRGFWGGKEMKEGRVTGEVAPDLAVDLLKQALKGAEGAIHSRSSNVYATLDNDDFYQYLGGTAMAIRQVNGATPEVLVTNMADPRNPRTETLEKYMGRELRARYLNPKWIDAMLKEGYAGARFVNKVVENLWGWTVATPDKIDDAKWQEMYETYVADKHDMGIRERFRTARNLLAYQAMVDRMKTAVVKGYWKASPDVVADLDRVNQEVIAEVGVACNGDTCSTPDIAQKAKTRDAAAAGKAQQIAPDASTLSAPPAVSSPTPTLAMAT
ncbi:MAG: cobaltochelatase subunit CobN, partial [Rhodocyclaceae bacterium]|nr:cobaltochelatase subunit CobN [Rhodocyclaceae bacterium]